MDYRWKGRYIWYFFSPNRTWHKVNDPRVDCSGGLGTSSAGLWCSFPTASSLPLLDCTHTCRKGRIRVFLILSTSLWCVSDVINRREIWCLFLQNWHKSIITNADGDISAEEFFVREERTSLIFFEKSTRNYFYVFSFLRKSPLIFFLFFFLQEPKFKIMKTRKLNLNPVGHPWSCGFQL